MSVVTISVHKQLKRCQQRFCELSLSSIIIEIIFRLAKCVNICENYLLSTVVIGPYSYLNLLKCYRANIFNEQKFFIFFSKIAVNEFLFSYFMMA